MKSLPVEKPLGAASQKPSDHLTLRELRDVGVRTLAMILPEADLRVRTTYLRVNEEGSGMINEEWIWAS